MTNVGTTHTIELTRTIEIDVTTTIYTHNDAVEIESAIDCETGEPIKLTESEVDQIHETALSDFIQRLKDAKGMDE
jgi:hypothetical protein|tara:strand:- start:736 stop:963 length:228 start_codon:yes stop_codon:yes gene_type:complete